MNEIELGSWVYIGQNRINAVVCQIISDNKLEVVYLDSTKKAINEYVILKQDIWIFENKNPYGGYAEKYQRLELYVSTLKEGRWNNRY